MDVFLIICSFRSLVEVIEEQVQVLLMISLHHIGVYLHVASCVYLKLNLVFSMLVMSSSWFIEVILRILANLRLLNDWCLIVWHEVCESLVSIYTVLHGLVTYRPYYALMLDLLCILLLSSLTLSTNWVHLMHLLLLRLVEPRFLGLLLIFVKVRGIRPIVEVIEEVHSGFR
jgi:hypothetical protein